MATRAFLVLRRDDDLWVLPHPPAVLKERHVPFVLMTRADLPAGTPVDMDGKPTDEAAWHRGAIIKAIDGRNMGSNDRYMVVDVTDSAIYDVHRPPQPEVQLVRQTWEAEGASRAR